MRKFQVSCVHTAQAGCGEGPVWDHRNGLLCWVDISGEVIHSFDPATGGTREIRAPYLISGLALCADGLLVATAQGIARLNPKDETLTVLHDPEPHVHGNRLNDILAGPDGTLWAGTMSEGAKGATGALYRYGPDGCEKMLDGTTISNGLAWSPDGARLYFIDSAPGVLHLRENGDWRSLVQFDAELGKPDGLTVDSAGMLWIAICDRGQVIGMTPEGEVAHRITLPCEIVTSCTFGGDDMKTLFVTTGTFSMSAEEIAANPQAGGLFAIDMDVPGPQSFEAAWPR